MNSSRIFPLPFVVFSVAVFLLPLAFSGSYVIGVMCFAALYGALALGKGVLLEQAGIFSLAHPTWFGLGAYVSGIAAVKGLPPLAAILLAAIAVALLALLLGAPLLRLKGYYLACATFSLMLIIEIIIANLGSLTGGHDGLMGIPALSIGGLVLEGDRPFYYLSWGLCLATYWFLHNLMRSRMGRAIVAFNDSETASRCLGINVAAYKLRLFVITAVMASLAGSLFCFWIRYIMPALFGFPLLVQLITMIIIGGGKTLYGPLLGSLAVMWLQEGIHSYLGKLLPVMTAEVDAIFFGILIVIILIFMPGGLAGWLDRLLPALRRSHAGNRPA